MTRRYHEGLSKEERTGIYDQAAPDYSERFSDPQSVAKSQLRLVMRWGTRVGPGQSVLEVGCADGYVTAALARAGLQVTAIDLSPRMIEVARARLDRAGLQASLAEYDIEESVPEGPFDAVVVLMRNFFSYMDEPEPVLARLASITRSKILIDCDPRAHDLRSAIALVRGAGFERVEWRPFFVPQRFKLGRVGSSALRVAEHLPVVRNVILRRKFLVVIKGEKG